MPSKILDLLHLFYISSISVLTSILQRLQNAFTIPDYAITAPSDIKSLSYFSSVRARVLWQTRARWCWFDKASKDDEEAGTRLGTLRFLPFEVREQIFKIVLEGYFDEVQEQINQEKSIYNRGRYPWRGHLDTSDLEIAFHCRHCSCKREKVPDIFDLRFYFGVTGVERDLERPPMSLRFASTSIRTEFDPVFLARRKFRFACPFTLQGFLDQLSLFQLRQLKSLRLSMFEHWACYSDSLTRRDQWMAACQRLPSGLKSVEIQAPYRSPDVPAFWTTRRRHFHLRQDRVNRVAAELLEAMCKKVSRASPRAVVSWTYHERLCKEEGDVLDEVLGELEPWSEEWHTWMDEMYNLG